MRSKFLKLSVITVLLLSFAAIGCPDRDCQKLKNKLEELQNKIIMIANERRMVDEEGKDMAAALRLHQEELNARRNFAETAEQYIAKGCQERTGDVPSLPPMNPVTETQFE